MTVVTYNRPDAVPGYNVPITIKGTTYYTNQAGYDASCVTKVTQEQLLEGQTGVQPTAAKADPNAMGVVEFNKQPVLAPQSAIVVYNAGIESSGYDAWYSAYRQIQQGYRSNNPDIGQGPQGSTGNTQDIVTGLWSRNPTNTLATYANNGGKIIYTPTQEEWHYSGEPAAAPGSAAAAAAPTTYAIAPWAAGIIASENVIPAMVVTSQPSTNLPVSAATASLIASTDFSQYRAKPAAPKSNLLSTQANDPFLQYYNPLNPDGTLKNLYVPEGNYMQQQFTDVKLGMSETGEMGIYEKLGLDVYGHQKMTQNPDTGKLEPYILIGGGSRAMLQSGTTGLAAATPAVYERGRVQYGRSGLITPNVMSEGAAKSGLTGTEVFDIVQSGIASGTDINLKLSRIGAEAYGGVVQRNDQRTLGEITYENVSNRATWNLASYVDPQGANKGKAELPGANIPWSVGVATPAMFAMNENTKQGEGSPAIAVKPFAAVMAPGYQVEQTQNTVPYVSHQTPTKEAAMTPVVAAGVVPIGGAAIPPSDTSAIDSALAGSVMLPAPFLSKSKAANTEYQPSGPLGLGGLLPAMPTTEQFKAYGNTLKYNFGKDPLGTVLNFHSEAVAAPLSAAGGAASAASFGLTEFIYKPEKSGVGNNNQWEKFVIGSGRITRAVTGQTLDKQAAYYETIRNEPGVIGEAKRGVYHIGTELTNKPAALAPAALTGALFAGVGGVGGGAVRYLGSGTGLTGTVARAVSSPTGQTVTKAMVGAGFSLMYGYGVTEGGTATIEKTKENVYRSVPAMAAMYGGAGGFNYIGDTEIAVGGFGPARETSFRGVAVGRDVFFGGGRTPTGQRYVGAFSLSENTFYGFGSNPVARPVSGMGRLGAVPVEAEAPRSYSRSDLPGLPQYVAFREPSGNAPGGLYANVENVATMTWGEPVATEAYAPGYSHRPVSSLSTLDRLGKNADAASVWVRNAPRLEDLSGRPARGVVGTASPGGMYVRAQRGMPVISVAESTPIAGEVSMLPRPQRTTEWDRAAPTGSYGKPQVETSPSRKKTTYAEPSHPTLTANTLNRLIRPSTSKEPGDLTVSDMVAQGYGWKDIERIKNEGTMQTGDSFNRFPGTYRYPKTALEEQAWDSEGTLAIPSPQPRPSPEPKPEPDRFPDIFVPVIPQPKPTPGKKPQTISFPKPQPKPQPDTQPSPKPQPSPRPQPKPQPNPTTEPQPKPFPPFVPPPTAPPGGGTTIAPPGWGLPSGGSTGGGYKKGSSRFVETLGFEMSRWRKDPFLSKKKKSAWKNK